MASCWCETINSKNQIITSNRKDGVFVSGRLNRNWNYLKDRLCGSFGDSNIGKYEEEFKIDINNDQFIKKSCRKDRKYKKIGDNSSKVIFKINQLNLMKILLK